MSELEMSASEYKQMMSTNNQVVTEDSGEVELEKEVTEEANDATSEDAKDSIEEKFNKIADAFLEDMSGAPVVKDEIGQLDHVKSPDSLKKTGYYLVFATKDHPGFNSDDDILDNCKYVRFETKPQLKRAIELLGENGYKLLTIIRGRPVSYEITVKKINEITIGD